MLKKITEMKRTSKYLWKYQDKRLKLLPSCFTLFNHSRFILIQCIRKHFFFKMPQRQHYEKKINK